MARQDRERVRAARSYIATVGLAQAGWVALAVGGLRTTATFCAFALRFALELAAPVLAERKARAPWHAEHIAERYGLLVIITLGEVITGTVAALNAVVHGEAGWTVDAAPAAIGAGLHVAAIAVALAAAGADVAICLLVLMAAPSVTVVGYETLGHRHIEDALQEL